MKTFITALAIITITLLLTPKTTIAQCHIDDWTALKTLYDSTDGDNWENRYGWDVFIANQSSPVTNCNLEDLFGVELDNEGRVVNLKLRSNELAGTIPPELGSLINLKRLDLDYNNLTGIPLELFNLINLEHLDLSSNQLTGKIPAELGNLKNLKSLRLRWSQLTGIIPVEIGSLINLVYIDLRNNNLTGVIPPQLDNLIKLKHFLATSNRLTGDIPKELGKLINLETLNLFGNELTGVIPPELGNLTNLEVLSLGNNQLTGSIPSELGKLNKITNFDLFYNQLSGCYSKSLVILCNEFENGTAVSDGNNFDASWKDFCASGAGVCPPVSTNSYDLNNEINFHYNHSSHSFHIISSNLPIENIALYNTNGQMLKNQNINNLSSVDIDVSYFAKGLYVVFASVSNQRFQTKFVIAQ